MKRQTHSGAKRAGRNGKGDVNKSSLWAWMCSYLHGAGQSLDVRFQILWQTCDGVGAVDEKVGAPPRQQSQRTPSKAALVDSPVGGKQKRFSSLFLGAKCTAIYICTSHASTLFVNPRRAAAFDFATYLYWLSTDGSSCSIASAK